MLKTILIISTLVVFTFAKCDQPCKNEFKHYKELGCNPVFEDGQCCPSHFDCPELTSHESGKCYFKGKSYNIRSIVADEDTIRNCAASCRCSWSYGSKTTFRCAVVECPEFFEPYDPECILQHSKTSCCSVNSICGEERKKLEICYMDGEKYYEGQKMSPKSHSCHSCLCKKGFDNSTILENQDCWEINCGIELRSLDKVNEGCIPVYYGENRCCPIAWRCPQPTDKIVSEGRTTSINPELKCKFGDLKMNLGDSLTPGASKCTTCKCLVPPMAQCIQNPDC